MICKDCELEVEKLNRKGICLTCARRMANANWKGEKYVAIKDLKGTHAYNIAMAKRLNSGKVKIPKNIEQKNIEQKREEVYKITHNTETQDVKQDLAKIIPQVENPKADFKEQCYEVVLKDAKAKFKQEHLDINFYKNIDLKGFLRTFTELLYNINNYEDSKKAEDIFNGLSIDYDHYLEQVDWNETALKNVYGLKKALLEIRRPNQTFQYNYNILKELLDYLREDRTFMTILDKTKKKIENNEPSIYGARASELVAAQDFATKRNAYKCEVYGHNYYGEQGRKTFTRTFYAINEESAKEQLNRFLAEQFSSFQYNQKDINITKI